MRRPPNSERFNFEPKRHVDIMPDHMQLNVNPILSNVNQAPFIVGNTFINQIERNFESELMKLKGEMRN